MLLLTAGLSVPTMAQENYELGKPNNEDYRYLDEYQALKEYIDYSKYPNFKLGAGTTVDTYISNSTYKNMIDKNFTETVAGNAMKMASCVDGNGNMNFSKVKDYVNAAEKGGISVYGHTLAWHSQQPKAWLLKLLADKKVEGGEDVWETVANKDFCSDKTIGWKATESEWGYSTSFSSTNGLVVNTTKSYPWQVQFVPMSDILLTSGKVYTMTMTVKGSKPGKLDGRLGDWGGGTNFSVNFNTEWNDVKVEVKPTMDNNFILLHVTNYVGDVYIKNIKFEGYEGQTRPLTQEERHDTLVWAMDKWIKGMMEACGGKVKAWDVVNEAISGGGNDGEGNYTLQHSEGYNPNGTWDVGGDAFYWQDYMGDLEYVRQAVRLARKYGPEDIKLFINDYNLESFWDNNKKLRSLINWIKKWEADGVTKIDGIGTQMHLSCSMSDNELNNRKKYITQMFKLMAQSGKLCRVSEFDMGMDDKNGNSVSTSNMTEEMHQRMADYYEWIVKQYLTIIPAKQQWGICHWCPTDSPEYSGWRANTPVGIWDINYYRKHAYAGFVRGFGGVVTGIEDVKADNSMVKKGIFDLSGRRISDATDFSSLPAGFYIVNGKKVVKH